MTKTLIQELNYLENRSDWRGTAAAHLLQEWNGRSNATGLPATPLLAPLPLNDSQEQLTARISTAPLTVATGPPGTGKSQMVVAAVANSWMRNESTLIVSTNNAAVDVAAERAQALASPALMRTGNKTHRTNLPALVSRALNFSKGVEVDEAVLRRDLAHVLAERESSLANLERRQELDVSLGDLVAATETASIDVWGSPGASELSLEDIRITVDQAGRGRFFRKRKQRRALSVVGAKDGASFVSLTDWLRNRDSTEAARAERLEVVGMIAVGDLDEINERWQSVSAQMVRVRIAKSLAANENRVSQLCTAPDGGPGLANAIHRSLGGLRAWACTALALKPNFPLEAGLFDHVIIDEASQCSLATILPAAYRAKRLTLVGDPNQLSPIIRLSDSLVCDVATASGLDHTDLVRRGLDHRSGSAFTAFAEAVGLDEVQHLDEHFRCHPLIARWFNTTFYGGRLTVLTDVGQWPIGRRGLQWIDTNGFAERPAGGSTFNRHEAERIVEELDSVLSEGVSVGVVAPFSAQANLIRKLAEKRFSKERLNDADFTVGTAHRFQGNERDIIIFSTVIAPGVSPRTARWVERERNLLNVAASRARHALVVFGHETAALEFNPTLSSLRSAAIEGPATEDATWAIHSESESRLLAAMHATDLAPAIKPYEEGFELDFAIVTPSIKLNVEVDGSQHLDRRGQQRRRDLARDRVLTGLGWTIVRFPSWRCMEDPDQIVIEIRNEIACSLARQQVADELEGLGPTSHRPVEP